MRIIYLFLLPIVLFSKTCPAQIINAGLKADINFFRIYGDGMTRQFHPGVSGGFFSEFRISSKWSVQPELLYSQRNTKTRNFSKFYSSSVSLQASDDVFLSYISLPVLIKYKFNNGLSALAGAQYNYLVYADENLLKDGKGAFRKNDFAMVAGLEYAVSKRVSFYGRFLYGLNDVNNVNTLHTWNTQQFQAGGGYNLFRFK